MSNFQEFNYYEIKHRPLFYLNTYLTLFVVTMVFTNLIIAFNYNFFYETSSRILFLTSVLGLFAGNLIGKFLFKKLENSIVLYYFSEISFLFFILMFLIVPRLTFASIPRLYGEHTIIFLFTIFSLMLFWGIKTNYFLKVGCGDFLDGKQALFKMIGFIILGVSSGLLFIGFFMINYLHLAGNAILIVGVVAVILLLTSMFFIKLKYHPDTKYIKDFSEFNSEKSLKAKARDSVVFVYLNFAIISIFIFMMYHTYMKVFGTSLYSSVTFVLCLYFSLLLGYLIGRIQILRISHVIAQILIPIVFLVFYYAIIGHSSTIVEFKYSFLVLVISLSVFGYIIIQSLQTVMKKFPQNARFEIMNFGLMILPVPIVLILPFINFTNIMFIILMYVLIIICLIMPGLYYLNKSEYGLKKIKLMTYILTLIVVLIFGHMIYDLPVNNALYVTRSQNFRELQSINFSADYIENKATIFLDRLPIFFLSDNSIKNMIRSALTIAVYHNDMQKDILVIDGNQSYFLNPVFSLFKNSLIINPLSEKKVDYRKLSVSGMPVYASDRIDPSRYLYKSNRKFFTIVENPNIMDQSLNSYRFSNEYISLLKERLDDDGIFAITFNLNHIRKEFLERLLYILNEKYKFHKIYIFPEMGVILNSDNEFSLQIVPEQIQFLNSLIQDKRYIANNILNSAHLLSNYYSSDLNSIANLCPIRHRIRYFYFDMESNNNIFDAEFFDGYFLSNSEILNTLSASEINHPVFNEIRTNLLRHKDVFTLLKKAEHFKARELYGQETEHLFALKRYANQVNNLGTYVNNILLSKEEYYFNVALEFEKNRNWEEAKTLYLAVLEINPNNFDANYRLGIIYLTLQELDNSFHYLRRAINIRSDHPQVLYQTGVLLFTAGRTNEALDYFNKAFEANERSASLFYYMGLSFERLGKMNEAANFYQRALFEDPNSLIIRERLDNINQDNQRRNNRQSDLRNQTEVEEGVSIPLPINRSAHDIRLGEDRLQNFPIRDLYNTNE